ncbi:MAG: ABC transporter ATP-binding protein [Chloroflexota bacterium]
MRVTASGIGVQIDGIDIVSACDLVAEPGELIGLVGPNGSGKSTLLRTIYRALRPIAGQVHLDDDDVWELTPRASALRTAVVAQEHHGDFDFSVEEVVAMGRTPHKGMFDRDTPEDLAIIGDALRRVAMSDFATRTFGTLSGGEKQRVLVARALAQQSRVLVLDEPTNHLDIRAQLDLLELVRNLGVTAIAALHDLNLAAAYCDRIVVLRHGSVVAAGAPADVLHPELLRDVFDVAAAGVVNPITGRHHLVFAPLARGGELDGASASTLL